MDADISPICRFCLEENEEFFHLANHCPALYWDRQQIWSQEPQNDIWSPLQILNFTQIPRINEAFVKPLYLTSAQRQSQLEDLFPSQPPDNPDATNSHSSSQSDVSVMDAESLAPSTESENDSDMEIDITH